MLTQLQITAAKPKAKPYNLSDGQGLVLAIQTTGSKLWRFRYLGKQKTLHIGPWPEISPIVSPGYSPCRFWHTKLMITFLS